MGLQACKIKATQHPLTISKPTGLMGATEHHAIMVSPVFIGIKTLPAARQPPAPNTTHWKTQRILTQNTANPIASKTEFYMEKWKIRRVLSPYIPGCKEWIPAVVSLHFNTVMLYIFIQEKKPNFKFTSTCKQSRKNRRDHFLHSTPFLEDSWLFQATYMHFTVSGFTLNYELLLKDSE